MWSTDPQDTPWLAPLAAAMKNLAIQRRQFGDEEGSERAFRQAIAWWEQLVAAGGEDQIAHWIGLATVAKEYGQAMVQWKRPDSDRWPVMVKRAESRLAVWEAGDRGAPGELIIALVNLGQCEENIGKTDSSPARLRKALEIVSSLNTDDQAKLSGATKGHHALAYEKLGQIAARREAWEEAEAHYNQSLEAWMEPGATLGAPGHLVANRVKIRLASLYRDSGRGDDPQRQQWYEEVYAALQPLEDAGELPGSLKWVLTTARNRLEATQPVEAGTGSDE